jgi:hypothetical protein
MIASISISSPIERTRAVVGVVSGCIFVSA